MIVVSVCEDKGSYTSVSIKGHGDMGYGKDIVCAGVSSCFIGALNALKDANSFEIIAEEGDGLVRSVLPISEHDKVVLETLVVQLLTISQSYPDTVKVVVSRKEG